ncbi:hypothetical protein LARV_03818 [Longilinea arvoryzae]|uniref:Uncharacterized protein n=1 Tax=Longilinea arvoryzae TaxID=360412 RepID=A0A0K8MXN6_9CHLR|nr:hypothetical protein [Longilinea arvoryzae]GAP16023.1 hypothetical protein LARV_03818 [Longilinea arvoryzae]
MPDLLILVLVLGPFLLVLYNFHQLRRSQKEIVALLHETNRLLAGKDHPADAGS